jgi:lysophospholipase L1-like esterase
VVPAAAAPSAYSSLAAAFDNIGIATGHDPQAADIDGQGHSLSAEDLAAAGWTPGTQVTVAGATIAWPSAAAGQRDNAVAAGQTITLRGHGTALALVVAATNGDSAGSGTITYADGSHAVYDVSAPDWVSGANDTKTLTLPHWNTPSGIDFVNTKLYTVLAPIDPKRTVRSITLPTTTGGALHVFALALRPATSGWAGTWSAAIDDGLVNGPWTDRTLRMVEHTSVGVTQTRIRLDNAFGRAPVTIGHATIAVEASGSAATATPRTLTFNGHRSVTIPAGGQAVSDAVGFAVPADTNLLVSLYLPGPVQLAADHSLGMQDMYSSADYSGDHTADVGTFPNKYTFGFWTLLSGIDVTAPAGSVVTLGDSITDGVGSTYNGNDRWPNDLARRLLGRTPAYGVADEGISANRIVTDLFTGDPGTGGGGIRALARLDRDVFSQTGVRSVVVLEGINDLKAGTPAEQVIDGLRQIAQQAHGYGLRVVVATITAFKGWSEYTPQYEANRQQVNVFIRNNGGVFDATVDFDAVTRDPADPQQLLAAYDSGDHLHPGPAGYHAMADAIDLSTL